MNVGTVNFTALGGDDERLVQAAVSRDGVASVIISPEGRDESGSGPDSVSEIKGNGGAAGKRPAGPGDAIDETSVLLDSVIHDLRTPLSAMSGWLEVLESHFGQADGIVGRALLGLRRGVDSQARGLNDLSDVLMKQRLDSHDLGEVVFLERLQQALTMMEGRGNRGLASAELTRLQAFRAVNPGGSLLCGDAGSSLVDACATLLQAISIAQVDEDQPLTVTADAEKVAIALPGAGGDLSALTSICFGLQSATARRHDIRAQSLWLARATLQRCGLSLRMIREETGGLTLQLGRDAG